MARRAIKQINWASIAERVGEAEKNTFAVFKSKSDQYHQRVMELPETPMKIDWAMYKQKVPVAGMVDRFQKEYESLKVPYPTDSYSSIIDSQTQEAMEHVKSFVEESNKRIEEYKIEAEKLRSLVPVEQMTLEDYAEAYPDHAINIDKPTIWPHLPDEQPGEEPEKMPKADH